MSAKWVSISFKNNIKLSIAFNIRKLKRTSFTSTNFCRAISLSKPFSCHSNWIISGVLYINLITRFSCKLIITYDNKKRLILSYMIFVVVYMFFMSTNIVPIILWKIKELIPIIGTGLSHGMEYLLSIIGGISPMDVGGNIFTIQYQWIMVLALPLILSYNHQRGKKCKYLFYIFYPIHIILLWLLSNFVFV